MGLHQVYVGECVLHTWEGSVLCCCWVQTLQMSSGFGVIVLLRPSPSSPSVLFYSISCWEKVLVSNLCHGAFCPFLPHLFWRSGIRGMHIRFWFPFFKVLMNVSCFQYETSLFIPITSPLLKSALPDMNVVAQGSLAHCLRVRPSAVLLHPVCVFSFGASLL